MIEIRIEEQPLYISKKTTLQLEVQNNAFTVNRIEGDIVFTFDVSAAKNDLVFKQARFVYVQRYKKYTCNVLVAGIEIAVGDLYIQKATNTNYSCGLVINPFPIDFAENKLSENDYGEDIIISKSAEVHRIAWEVFLKNSLRENSIYKFPLFINTAFYGAANKDFGWFLLPKDTPSGNNQSGFQASLNTNDKVGLDKCYLNRLFTDSYGSIIEEWSSGNRGIRLFNNTAANNPNSFAFAPAIQLLWIFQKVIENGGYQIIGNFQTESAIKKIYSQSLRALDGLASQFDNAVAKTTVTITPSVSFVDTTEEDLILPFIVDNQQYYCIKPLSSRGYQFSVSINTYLPANLLLSGTDPKDAGITYKDAVIFLLMEEWEEFPEYLYDLSTQDWNKGIGYLSNGKYTPFDSYFKIYTLNQLQSQIGYNGAGFYTFNFNFSQNLVANRKYKLFFGKVRGYTFTDLCITRLKEYQNIYITQNLSAFHNLCNIFANKLKFSEHVPGLSNSDFISTICNCFGLSMFIDSTKKQIEFSFFRDILNFAQAIDLSAYLLNKKSYIEKNDPKKYRFRLDSISIEDIDETKLLPPVRTYSQLPNAVTHYGKICFVENENRYHIAERVGDAVQNWVFRWNPYAGNNQILEIGEGDNEDITPQMKIPNMKIAEEKANDGSHFLLNIEMEGCSPIFATGNKEFEMILINYIGRKKLNLDSVYYEHATPVCMDRQGNQEQGISLTATGTNSVGETYTAPWLSFLASYEKICHTFLLPVSAFMEVLQLLKPQDVPINRQTRFVIIDSVKLMPIKMTFQFTEGSRNIIAEIVFAKERVELGG